MTATATATATLRPENARTLATYYSRVNLGDFLGVSRTLSPDVVYSIPGDTAVLPFAGEWVGRDRVLDLFRAFGAAFRIVSMAEMRTITGEDCAISFNDEAFKVNSTGRYYRVGVVHHIEFDENHLIKSLVNVHDTYPAMQSFRGQAPILEPLPLATPLDGEATLANDAAHECVETLIGRLEDGRDIADLLDERVEIYAPGDATQFPLGGVWMGPTEVAAYFQRSQRWLADREPRVEQVVANNGSVAVISSANGMTVAGEPTRYRQYDLVQVTGAGKIGRVTSFVDTYPLVNGGRPSNK
jgi:ketosteroid isomerase-like protein